MVTVITKTIGSGRDYASFTAAEADVQNIATLAFGSTDLVANDGAIVFEADAATYNESVTFSSTLTTDATRNVTYKAAAGSEHGGDPATGVILGTGANTQTVQDDYTVLSGLHLNGSHQPSGDGAKVSGCILTRTSGTCATTAAPNNTVRIVYENSVFRPASTSFGFSAYGQYGSATVGFYNCTFSFQAGATSARGLQSYVVSPYENDFDIVNCIAFVGGSVYSQSGAGTHTIAGSNNFGSSSGPFPVATQGSPYPITATTDLDPGPGDWAIYDAATGALIDDPDNDVLAGGIGPDANPDVPTTDIVGNTRSGATTDPGAFEISTLTPPEPPGPELITIMRQIYQQDASFSIGASSAGVEKITHQLGPASADYFTINSTTSATVSVPRTAHALRVICVVASKACDVTLDLDASNSVYLGSIGGVASVQTDLTYFWSFGQVVSDGTYPRVRIVNDGFAGDQNVYLWWHLA